MKKQLQKKIHNALNSLGFSSDQIIIQTPKRPEQGDLSTNTAMILSRILKKPPLEIAEMIKNKIEMEDTEDFFEFISIAPPGFINFKINTHFYTKQLIEILSAGENFGSSNIGLGKKALVEFVSANPTGPLTVGHGRGAMLGDTVSNILQWNGFKVQREYYFNDAGRQMRILGESVYARYMELTGETVDFPEDGYQGEYIQDIAKTIMDRNNESLKGKPDSPIFRESAEDYIFKEIKSSIARLGLVFDTFFNERELYKTKAIDKVVNTLKKKGLIYEKDDAIWYKGTAIGRESDRVLIKSTGEPTYRLPDIAYHQDKLERKYDLIIDVFGADHIETFPDVLSAIEQLGYDPNIIRVLIHQFVTIIKDGEQVKMSTRKANFVTLDELTDEVGEDIVRYFFIMRGMNTHLNFDLDLAMDQSDENPVFYLQYAHARVCNILKRAEAFEHILDPDADLTIVKQDIELQLIRKLLEFPEIIQKSLEALEPQSIANYLQEMAGIFHRFYAHERVISDDGEKTAARLILTKATQIVMANGLKVLGISAPERM